MTELPASWVTVPAGDLMRFEYGKGLPKRVRRSGPVGVYSSAGLAGTHDEALVDEPAIVIGRKGAAGKITLTEGPAWVIDTAFYVVPPSDLNIKFVAYQLEAAHLASRDQSTAIPSLSRESLKALPFHVPPRAEQDRIVEAVESAMAAVRRGMDELSEAVLLTAALRDGVLEHALPGGTSEVELQECLHEPPRNGRSVPTASSGFPVLRLTAIKDGRVDTREAKTGAWSEEEARPFLIREGDFLVVRGNGSLRLVGRGGLVGTAPERVAYPDTLIRLRPNPERLSGEYLRAVWHSRRVRRQLESQARTTAGIYKINQQMLKTLRIPLPPLDVQRVVARAIENRLAEFDSLTLELEKQSRAARHLEFQLLQRALSGQLVTQDPADEPASELLKRIEAEKAEREAELKTARRRRRKSRPGSSAETTKGSRRPPSQSGKVGTSSD